MSNRSAIGSGIRLSCAGATLAAAVLLTVLVQRLERQRRQRGPSSFFEYQPLCRPGKCPAGSPSPQWPAPTQIPLSSRRYLVNSLILRAPCKLDPHGGAGVVKAVANTKSKKGSNNVGFGCATVTGSPRYGFGGHTITLVIQKRHRRMFHAAVISASGAYGQTGSFRTAPTTAIWLLKLKNSTRSAQDKQS